MNLPPKNLNNQSFVDVKLALYLPGQGIGDAVYLRFCFPLSSFETKIHLSIIYGGFLINTGALSVLRTFRHNFFVFNTMAQKLCKEQQISFDNNIKYSDFIAGKYIYVYVLRN